MIICKIRTKIASSWSNVSCTGTGGFMCLGIFFDSISVFK